MDPCNVKDLDTTGAPRRNGTYERSTIQLLIEHWTAKIGRREMVWLVCRISRYVHTT